MIRSFLIFLALSLYGLTGCASVGAMTNGLVGGGAQLDPRFQRGFNGDAPRYDIAVSSIGVNSVMVLLETRDGVSTWIGPFGEAIVLQNGFIRGTRGLGEGLIATDVRDASALIMAGNAGQTERFHSYLTGGGSVVVHSFVCDIAPRGARSILQGTREIMAQLIEEDCTGPSGAFTNKYWIASGEVIQSRQWVGPTLGEVRLRLQTL